MPVQEQTSTGVFLRFRKKENENYQPKTSLAKWVEVFQRTLLPFLAGHLHYYPLSPFHQLPMTKGLSTFIEVPRSKRE